MGIASRIKHSLRDLGIRCGYDVNYYRLSNDIVPLRGKLLKDLGVGLVLDVGANIGIYGHDLRTGGYQGRIVSFEPLSGPFASLSERARADGAWECRNSALGNRDEMASIGVSNLSYTSSFLSIGETLQRVIPEIAKVDDETVQVSRLDTLAGELFPKTGGVFLKLDVQGYERHVLEGAQECLDKIVGIECELSVVTLYEGQPLFREMIDYLDDLGFTCFHLSRGLCDETSGKVLQLDGIFVRA